MDEERAVIEELDAPPVEEGTHALRREHLLGVVLVLGLLAFGLGGWWKLS